MLRYLNKQKTLRRIRTNEPTQQSHTLPSCTSQPADQSFVKELAKPTQEKLFLKNFDKKNQTIINFKYAILPFLLKILKFKNWLQKAVLLNHFRFFSLKCCHPQLFLKSFFSMVTRTTTTIIASKQAEKYWRKKNKLAWQKRIIFPSFLFLSKNSKFEL